MESMWRLTSDFIVRAIFLYLWRGCVCLWVGVCVCGVVFCECCESLSEIVKYRHLGQIGVGIGQALKGLSLAYDKFPRLESDL